jgi:hypothetical protein
VLSRPYRLLLEEAQAAMKDLNIFSKGNDQQRYLANFSEVTARGPRVVISRIMGL